MPGAPSMKMYSRDDLMNMKNFGEEEDDDDDDDDDDEDARFPSKLVWGHPIYFAPFLLGRICFMWYF